MRTKEEIQEYLTTCKKERDVMISRTEKLDDDESPERDLLWSIITSIESTIQTLIWTLEESS